MKKLQKQISRMLVIALLISELSVLSACQQPGAPPGSGISNETGGTVLGGVGGALLGSTLGRGRGSLVGAAAGGLLGAFVGNRIGASLDQRDQAIANQTSQRAFETAPSNQPVTWRNPDSGHYGTIVTQPAYQSPQGQYCREYTQTINVGGQNQRAYGTACRQPDGTWQIVSSNQ